MICRDLNEQYLFICSSGFGGEKWKTNVLLTALLCPGYVDFLYNEVKVVYNELGLVRFTL